MVYHNTRIRNKERVGFRGKKKRYSVFRAELNQKWERCMEEQVKKLCEDNDLNVEEQMVEDERIPWEHTWDKLREEGYRFNEFTKIIY